MGNRKHLFGVVFVEGGYEARAQAFAYGLQHHKRRSDAQVYRIRELTVRHCVVDIGGAACDNNRGLADPLLTVAGALKGTTTLRVLDDYKPPCLPVFGRRGQPRSLDNTAYGFRRYVVVGETMNA